MATYPTTEESESQQDQKSNSAYDDLGTLDSRRKQELDNSGKMELKFIKKFLSLHNRQKTKTQILSFIRAIKKAILERRIRKASEYAAEIMQIQKQLITAYEIMNEIQNFSLSPETIKRFSKIVSPNRIKDAGRYLKSLIGIHDKSITKERAEKLLLQIKEAIDSGQLTKDNPEYQFILNVSDSLKKFLKVAKGHDTLSIRTKTLDGLEGILGCNGDCNCNCDEEMQGIGQEDPGNEQPEVMTIQEARQREFELVPIADPWLKLIGQFSLPTQFFVYGPGGGGKSSFVLLFTQYLASLGYKILYVAGEQFNTPTFTALVNNLNIVAGDNFQVVGKIETLDPALFDFVILDSKDQLEMGLNEFLAIREHYPAQSFIVLSQAVKTGSFTGKERWRNVMDVLIRVENGIARTGQDKNRWGGAGEMLIFDHPKQYLSTI